MAFHPLEKLGNLYDGYRKVFHIGDLDLLLIQHESALHLLDNICPHAAYPLHEGMIIGGDLRCPMHGYLFNLQSGKCTYSTEGPCRDLPTYAVEIRGDDVGVMLPR